MAAAINIVDTSKYDGTFVLLRYSAYNINNREWFCTNM
jgi:hypothetical protein